MGLSGPNLRASGVPYDLRRTDPYLTYPEVEFDVVVGERGDAYDRFLCRTKEMYESVRIIEQCLDKMPSGPVMATDRKYVLPPRAELHTSMESLIHHFKLVTEGFRVPPGQVYFPVESPRGEFGCYLVSDGGTRPWRAHFRAPSFVSLQVTAMMSVNRYVGDMIVVVGSLDGVMGEADR
jgi:NADH-quinone oxidoreductase subunit D